MVQLVSRGGGQEAVARYGRPVLVLGARSIQDEYELVEARFPGSRVLMQELRIDAEGCPFDVLTVAPAAPGAVRVRVWFAIGDFFQLPGQPKSCQRPPAPSYDDPATAAMVGADAPAAEAAHSYTSEEAAELLEEVQAAVTITNMDVLAQVHGGDRPARDFDVEAWNRFLELELPTSVLVPGVAPQYGPDGPMGWRDFYRLNKESPVALSVRSDGIAREANEYLSAVGGFREAFIQAGGTPSGSAPRKPTVEEMPQAIPETEELPKEFAKGVILGPLATKTAQSVIVEHARDVAKATGLELTTAQLSRYAMIVGGVTLGALVLGVVLALR